MQTQHCSAYIDTLNLTSSDGSASAHCCFDTVSDLCSVIVLVDTGISILICQSLTAQFKHFDI